MVLFELLVVNNWTVTCSGFVLATGTAYSRIYFVAFHVVGVIVVNNLVVSFIVDAFSGEYEAEKDEAERAEGEERQAAANRSSGLAAPSFVGQSFTPDGEGVKFDAGVLSNGSAKGKWVATVKHGERKNSLLDSIFMHKGSGGEEGNL